MASRAAQHCHASQVGATMEHLEQRTLFGGSPFPTLEELQEPLNTVVRLDTNFGDIDIELFDSVAPVTVTNFLRYMREGAYDQMFFHRLVRGFVLQGGLARLDDHHDPQGPHTIFTHDPIQNEFSLTNAARTIAMAKVGGNPNSATSQFFINLANNTSLDTQNGGFTVFGRVANERSWTVVLDMADSEVIDGGAPYDTLPVTDDYVDPASEEELLFVRDAEVIKAGGQEQFYTVRAYYPEGFAGSTISEFLNLANPGDTAVHYQIIARAEVVSGGISTATEWYRDRVISTGTIAAHSRGGVTVSQFGPGGLPGASDLLPQGVPYSLEVLATGDLGANLSHYDFGTSTGEAFTASSSTTWGFGEAVKLNGSVFDFLVWSNPNAEDANLAITFFFQSGLPVTINVTTEGLRRGGLAFPNVAELANGTVFSARIVSNVPIVAALSHYDNRGDQQGSTALGVDGNGLWRGVIPMGAGGAGVSQVVTFFNANFAPAVVTMVLRFENPAQEITVAPTLVIPSMRRATLDLATLVNARVQAGEAFSIRYTTTAQTTPVYGHASKTAMTDVVSNPFAIRAATDTLFAEGFMDPARAGADVFETVSVYNPNSQFFTGATTTANVTFTFLYTDGFTFTHDISVAGGGRADLNLHTFQPLLDQGTDNARFFYSVRVTSNVPVIAQMFHYDLSLGGLQASGGFSTLGSLFGDVRLLTELAG